MLQKIERLVRSKEIEQPALHPQRFSAGDVIDEGHGRGCPIQADKRQVGIKFRKVEQIERTAAAELKCRLALSDPTVKKYPANDRVEVEFHPRRKGNSEISIEPDDGLASHKIGLECRRIEVARRRFCALSLPNSGPQVTPRLVKHGCWRGGNARLDAFDYSFAFFTAQRAVPEIRLGDFSKGGGWQLRSLQPEHLGDALAIQLPCFGP